MITAGQSIGNYRILAKIGTGGMGAVYLAEHPLIGKRVALKVIHKELANNRDVVSRFFQEARAVNQIGNEHIVEIHDFGVTPEGDHFYIMEYLDGKTLAGVIGTEKVIAPMRALHIGAQIASALGAAHANGVIHRDLKPDNVMLLPKLGDPDFVKVLDFGLAKVFQQASAVKTAAGVLLGTPQYMSPEACESRGGIDHRTDIYALGVLLFQMMTGRLPFEGDSMGEILVKQVTALPPAPRGFNASIPPSVEQVLLRCLAKPVDQRFQSMGALREALLSPDAYLGSAPPMQPARSVAPGEMGFSAAALVAHAAQLQANSQQQQRTTLGTMVAPQMPRPTNGRMSAQQPTMIADAAGNFAGSRAGIPVPGLMPPTAPKMNTMRIATPLGYVSRPPRKTWPIVVALGLILGLGGGAFAVWWFRKPVDGSGASAGGSATGTSAAGGNGSNGTVTNGNGGGTNGNGGTNGSNGSGTANGGGVNGSGTGTNGGGTNGGGSGSGTNGNGGTTTAGSAGSATAPVGSNAPARMASVTLDSIPEGADVFLGGFAIGKTPLKTDLPIAGEPITLVFKLAGYRNVDKTTTISGNASFSVALQKATKSAPVVPPHATGSGSSHKTPEGLERPGD